MVDSLVRRILYGPKNPRSCIPAPQKPAFEQLEDRLLLSLIGLDLEPPTTYYDANGVVAYDAAAQAFDSDATPTAIQFMPGTRPIQIQLPRDFQLHILVDNTGGVIGGVAGDDLYIEGQIDVDRDGIMDYDGVLLTGEIQAFGFLDTGTTTDQYDFRFTPTGGDLMPFFEGKDIGVRMTSISSNFVGSFAENFNGKASGLLGPVERPITSVPGSLAGRVFIDANNNGLDDGEDGIEGVSVTLSGTDVDGNPVSLTTLTGPDGSYLFGDIEPGTYELASTTPAGYLDGIDVAGSLGGTAGNDLISGIVLDSGEDGTGYLFGELVPGSLSGYAYEDFNNDGEIDFNELAIEGVTVTLSGVDDRGEAVSVTDTTDADGIYFFVDLRPGVYSITETQPAGYEDGIETLGTAGGVVGDDVFSEINLAVGVDGMNYNFAERPQAGAEVTGGQTATIGFWQNKNGQNLIKSLNDGADSLQLGNWLAATFPNMYGAQAGDNNLAGMTNTEIAEFYRTVFRTKAKKQRQGEDLGPAKFDSQVMATAFAVYVTNSSLAGDAGTHYGFLVTDYGVGIATFNIGSSGEAFDVADNTDMAIMDILLATNEQSVDGQLYDLDGILRRLANEVYSAINEAGDIG